MASCFAEGCLSDGFLPSTGYFFKGNLNSLTVVTVRENIDLSSVQDWDRCPRIAFWCSGKVSWTFHLHNSGTSGVMGSSPGAGIILEENLQQGKPMAHTLGECGG